MSDSDDTVQNAASIDVAACSCGNPHIMLFNEAGRLFAQATVAAEELTAFIAKLCSAAGVSLQREGESRPMSFFCPACGSSIRGHDRPRHGGLVLCQDCGTWSMLCVRLEAPDAAAQRRIARDAICQQMEAAWRRRHIPH